MPNKGEGNHREGHTSGTSRSRFKPCSASIQLTLTLKGSISGDMIDFEGARCNCPA